MFTKPKTEPYWYALKNKGESPEPLKDNQSADIVIVGGGITGLLSADTLLKSGFSVIVLERNFCGAGATGLSSGFITPASEIDLSTLIKESGIEEAKKIWGFIDRGVELIKTSINEHGLECEYKEEDSLYVTDTENDIPEIKAEYESRNELGFTGSLYEERESLKNVIGSDKYYSGLRYGGTFSINALAFCESLKKSLIKKGVIIYENSPVSKINEGHVLVNGFKVSGSKIIFCGDRFVPELGGLRGEVYHVQVFTAVSKPLTDLEVKEIFPEGHMMVWDTGLVYKYFRLMKNNRLLVGGDDIFYVYTKKEKIYPRRFLKSVLKYFKTKFPKVNLEIDYVWPGLMGISKDFMPVLSEDKKMKNVFYIGGTSGLPWGASLGSYMAEKIMNGRNDFDSYFSPERKFPVSHSVQKILGNKLTFALSHAIHHGVFKKIFP